MADGTHKNRRPRPVAAPRIATRRPPARVPTRHAFPPTHNTDACGWQAEARVPREAENECTRLWCAPVVRACPHNVTVRCKRAGAISYAIINASVPHCTHSESDHRGSTQVHSRPSRALHRTALAALQASPVVLPRQTTVGRHHPAPSLFTISAPAMAAPTINDGEAGSHCRLCPKSRT